MKANDRFQASCKKVGYEPDIQFFPEGTKTASDAAAAVGCDVAQIVKSLVFMTENQPILLLVSGKNRVDQDTIKLLLDAESFEMAKPEIVRTHTGFAIGGTPPFAIPNQFRQSWTKTSTYSIKFGPQREHQIHAFPSHQLNFLKLLMLLLQQ